MDPLPSFRQGRGEPLVLLPGLSFRHDRPTGALRLFESALIGGLARHFAVHWLGRRPGVPEGFAPADFAADYAAEIRRRFGRAMPVVGFSTGGLLGLQLALDHPEAVARLVVIGTAARLSEAARASDQRWITALEGGRIADAWAALLWDRPNDQAPTGARRAIVGALGAWLTPPDCTDGIRTARAEVGMELTGRLPALRVPTLLVVGGQDHYVGVDLAMRTWGAIDGGHLLVLPRAGHLVSMIHPRTTDRVVEFLAG